MNSRHIDTDCQTPGSAIQSSKFDISFCLFLLLLFSSFSSFSQSPSFSFAWLSDTHVGGTTGAEDLRRSVDDLNTMDSLDFVILSGDITEMGWRREFLEASEILSHLTVPYFIIPGNHDMKWSESAGQEFIRIFGSDRFVFRHRGVLFVGVHQGPVLRMGDGHFAPEDVRWLDSLVLATDPSAPLIFVTHYPLTPSIDNWYEATNRLRTLNTQAVLVGHGHRDRVMDFSGLPGVMGRSNLRAREKNGGYTIVTVGQDSLRFFERITGKKTKPQRAALPRVRRTYEQRQESVERPQALDMFENGQAMWTVQTGWTMTSSPALYGQWVFIADRSGMVRCLHLETGKEVWRTDAGAPVLGNISTGEGLVTGTTTAGEVFCLEAATGRKRWSVPTGHANVGSPALYEGVVYTGTSSGSFIALNASDGSQRSNFNFGDGFVESRPLVTNDYVVFGAWNSYLYCLDRKTGLLKWKWNNGREARLLSPAAVWPVLSGNRLFIVAPDRMATVLDIEDGRVLWRSSAHQVRESAGISEDGTRFYAKSMNDTLFAYDARSGTERLAWFTDCGYGYDIANSMPREKDGTVFFGTKNGLVYAVQGNDGKVEWVYKLGNTIINTVAPVGADRVLVTNLDGTVALLGHPD